MPVYPPAHDFAEAGLCYWSIRLTRDIRFEKAAQNLASQLGCSRWTSSLLALFVPSALEDMARMRGEAIDAKAGRLDLSLACSGRAMRLPLHTLSQTRRLTAHISSSLGPVPTSFWSPRRTVLTALLLHGETLGTIGSRHPEQPLARGAWDSRR